MKNNVLRLKIAGLLLIAALMIGGCSKLNQENYSKLRMGMTYAEVTDLLGSPERCDAAIGMKSCTWGDEKKNITVNFLGEKVVFFSGRGI